MIGKTTTGKGFKGVLNYCLQENKNAEVLDLNGLSRNDAKGLTNEFEAITKENINISKPVWHTSLSFSEMDNMTNERMTEIANKFLEKAGFTKDNNQFVIIKHNDKAHIHCHIVANRVGFDGKAVSDYYCKSKTVSYAKQLENEYGITKVQEIAQERRRINELSPDKDFTKEQIKETIDKTLKQPDIKTIQDLSNALQKQGIETHILSHIKTGKDYGVSFKAKGKSYKGSDLGKKYAFKALTSLLPSEVKIVQKALQTLVKGFELEI